MDQLIISPHLADALATALLHSLWQGALVFFLAHLVSQSRLIRNAGQRFAIYFGGLLTLPVLTIMTFFGSYGAHQDIPGTAQHQMEALGFNTLSGSSAQSVDWTTLITIAWLIGTLVFTTRHIVGWVNMKRWLGKAMPAPAEWQEKIAVMAAGLNLDREFRLLTTVQSSVPFVFGTIKPVVLFPLCYFTQLTHAQIESVLMHELAHIRRHDFLCNCIQLTIESLMFYHPAVWILSKKLRLQREYACDDIVKGNVPDQKVYLEALYQVAAMAVPSPATSISLINNQSELVMRVKRMLNMPYRSRFKMEAIPAIAGLLVVGALLLASTHPIQATLAEQPDGDKNEVITRVITQPIVNDLLIGEIEVPQSSAIDASVLEDRSEESTRPKANSDHQRTIALDSIPKNDRVKKLEKELEAKQLEMEKLSNQLEKEMEGVAESDMRELERLSQILEQRIEKEMGQIEEMPEMLKLEELSEALGSRMEELSEDLESLLDKELMASIEMEMEKYAMEFNQLDSVTPEHRRQFTEEMGAFKQQMEEATRVYRERHELMRNDPEMIRLREELNATQEQLRPLYENHHLRISDETEELKKQMEELHASLRTKMEGMGDELRVQLEAKAKELQQIHMELEKEYRKQQKEKNH